ncbi:hypothetical protein COLO4_16725 [Corchorus olitorius]|uniref:Uncharacterized protein n=1 Tax=Corchorus olitorius TaxID=93759 RepID=A0A1R3JFW6_9ROSI|nr:hypothetical protein COLO4_16725 [Corchorus olitorius]
MGCLKKSIREFWRLLITPVRFNTVEDGGTAVV